MSPVRLPAVADYFYPADAQALRAAVHAYLGAASATAPMPKAIVAPHAGYIYSGSVAASAYRLIRDGLRHIERVVLLGPAHRVYVRGCALSSARYFATPLGHVAIDQEACAALGDVADVSLADEAHALEHSLEVHLPFLQLTLGEFKLTPIVVGAAAPASVAAVLERLWGDSETLIVVSTDLSHYHDYETARAIDMRTMRAIEALDYREIGGEQACGSAPLNGLLHFARNRNLQVRTLDLRNSGDTAGSRDRVVGYGAWALHEEYQRAEPV